MSGRRDALPPLPPGAIRLDEALVAEYLPARDANGHKGTFGSLLAVCGSLDFAGAALLAGTAALRAGAGLVTLCLPASLQPVLAGRVPELITLGLPERQPHLVDPETAATLIMGRPHTALLLGPGLRATDATHALVHLLLRDDPAGAAPPKTNESMSHEASVPPHPTSRPAVVDAEALNALAASDGWWVAPHRPLVLTPHPGEFTRLEATPSPGDDDERCARAAAAAARWDAVVVLKGARTVVAAPDGRIAMAAFENPALASGGTGDVLAGTIASLLAQGVAPWQAACLGVYLHGIAGEHVRERFGDAGLLASDLLPELPRVRRHLVNLHQRALPDRPRLGFAPRGPNEPAQA
jgi:NAD(P)H-hydrate epimerase